LSNDWWYGAFPFGLSEEQMEALEEAGYITQPIPASTRSAFDLEEQTDDEWAEFLAEVEAKANEGIDRELEKEAEASKRVSDLQDSVEGENDE
jgi:hypothetical protein